MSMMPELTCEAVLSRLATVIESRNPSNGGDPASSYVARLLQGAPDRFLKKIGEEATEVVLAAKDVSQAQASGAGVEGPQRQLIGEVADLWFHCLVALAHYGLRPEQVVAELARREGTSGIEEMALRKALTRDRDGAKPGGSI